MVLQNFQLHITNIEIVDNTEICYTFEHFLFLTIKIGEKLTFECGAIGKGDHITPPDYEEISQHDNALDALTTLMNYYSNWTRIYD